MSEKSGVSSQALSLPKGGGAIEGAGGKFMARQQTGAGEYSLPLSLPAGRRNLSPSLALTYNTGNGNGEFGHGWTLGTAQVARKTSDGVPIYDQDADTFLLSEGEDLVPVGERTTDDDTTITRYRPRTEGEFGRIERHQSPTTDHWVIQDKDGTIRRYGRPGQRGADPATVADPGDRTKVFRWLLSETVDPLGNCIKYDYRRDAGETADHYWDQCYLERLRYVDYENDDGDTEFLVSVEFEYEDRPDPFSQHTAGFEVRTTERCSRIVIRTHADATRPVRSYELTYRDDTGSPSANGLSQLARIDILGHADGETEALPPLEFTYADYDPENRDFEALSGPLPRQSLSAPELQLAAVIEVSTMFHKRYTMANPGVPTRTTVGVDTTGVSQEATVDSGRDNR